MKSKTPLDRQPDAALVARYAAVRDEEAFGEVVRRHGPMVLATCTRVLRHQQDAEDAFQAVFIVLAARSRALRRVRSVGGWLHSVAVRVSYGVLRGNRRRTQRLSASQQQSQPEIEKGDHVYELHAVLDEELTALPAKYREALVLCDLEGNTREEAARILNASAGSVATWVARGRRRLRERLVRRGVTLGAGGLVAAVAHSATAAQSLPATLVQETLRHADFFTVTCSIIQGTPVATKVTSLAKGELNTMFLSKISKSFGIVALALLLWFGASPASQMIGIVTGLRAAQVFFDDFEDGSVTDGSPVTWAPIPAWPLTTINVLGGDLRLGVSTTNPNQSGVVAVPSITLGNSSIRTQVRFEGQSNPDEGCGVFVRGDLVNNKSHSFEVATDGGLWFAASGSALQRIDSDLRPTQEDVILQLDAIGNTISAWAWRVGQSKPAMPAFSRITDLLPSGSLGVYKSASLSSLGTSMGTAIFRYVNAGETPIPEPSTVALSSLGGVALMSFAFRRRLGRMRR